jgi:uncharacterized membrane protein YoaK (UPF0700 family)
MEGPAMKYLWALLVFVCGEVVAYIIFLGLKRTMGPAQGSPASKWAVTKGILERLTLVTGLVHDFPHILIAFGALKIGTRLREDQNSHITNTYFLTGNLISILLSMVYAIIIKRLWD